MVKSYKLTFQTGAAILHDLAIIFINVYYRKVSKVYYKLN